MTAARGSDALQMGAVTEDAGGPAVHHAADGAEAAVLNTRRRNAAGSAGPPYVCTGCRDMAKCTLEKRSYSPVIAQKEYRELLSSSREMIRCTDEEIKEMDRTISEGLAKGHSINHSYSYAGDAMPVSQRTAYEYINPGVFSESIRLSQPRAVRMKPRRKPVSEDTAGRERFIGRTYADFLLHREASPDTPIAEFDCVEGKKGGNGRVLLTICHIRSLPMAYARSPAHCRRHSYP